VLFPTPDGPESTNGRIKSGHLDMSAEDEADSEDVRFQNVLA
jgi:hypothetical protein